MAKDDSNNEHARGCGPNAGKPAAYRAYAGATAAWGATVSVGLTMLRQGTVIDGVRSVFRMNKHEGGFDCPGCAWPDDERGLRMDICENGIKHSAWEMTKKRATPDFFAKHTVAELSTWSDFALEDEGRLTEPLAYDATSDTYKPISWEGAFALIGKHLRALASPNQASFYTSGRLSNEATFLYQLFARELGTNNLPDCSNMCHEASGRALRASIGTGKGTVNLEDWHAAEAVFILGANAASNAPRMLSALTEGVRDRGMKVVHVNPLIEAGARPAIAPHDLVDMALFRATPTSSLDIQPKLSGDFAFMRGIGKWLFEQEEGDPEAIDRAFIAAHTLGVEAYRAVCVGTSWEDIERLSGVPRARIEEAGAIYRASKATIFSWCLGISQQEFAVDAIREITNVLLLRGNLGRKGAGACPIRGHSNVQGNRTCGVDHAPTEAWLARLDAACGIVSPRKAGLDTVETIEAMHRGEVHVFVGMGGNFAMACPDTAFTQAALRKCALTVQVSTKLNRSHLAVGREALILPCLARSEVDMQASGPQRVTVEDSMSMVHLSGGMNPPASSMLRSELAIIAQMAIAALPDTKTPWTSYIASYDAVRETMAKALVGFEDFNARVREGRGFRIDQPARRLEFTTPSGKAELSSAPLPEHLPPEGKLALTTVRSHDQWNTTIYSDDDRYRGIKDSRTVILMNEEDMRQRGISHLDLVNVTSFAKDGGTRSVTGYRAIRYDIPRGSCAGYMPELNVLCPLGDYSRQSRQPVMKHLVVDIQPSNKLPSPNKRPSP